MSPEQIRGQSVDARTDVFAAGVVLWECLAKRRLFRVDGQDSNPDSVLTLPIFPPSHFEPSISPALDSVVLRALSRDRAQRYASAAEFAEALRAVMEPASPLDVGRWVTQAAKRSIADRSGLLQDLETSTINVARSGVPPRFGRTSTTLSAKAEAVDHPNANQATVVLDGHATIGESRGLHGWSLFALFLAAAGAVTLLGMTLIAATAKRAPLAPNVSATETRPAAPAASSRATPAEQKPSTPDAPETLESLPVLAAPRSAERRAPATESSATRSGDVATSSPEPPAPKSAPAAPKQKTTAESPAPKPERAPVEPATSARSCDPPYRIDQHGIRRVRRECL
jgi:serine/threonine-protein kinase